MSVSFLGLCDGRWCQRRALPPVRPEVLLRSNLWWKGSQSQSVVWSRRPEPVAGAACSPGFACTSSSPPGGSREPPSAALLLVGLELGHLEGATCCLCQKRIHKSTLSMH